MKSDERQQCMLYTRQIEKYESEKLPTKLDMQVATGNLRSVFNAYANASHKPDPVHKKKEKKAI